MRSILLLLLLLLAGLLSAQNPPVRWSGGVGVPASAACDAAAEVGSIYIQTGDPATAANQVFACRQTGASTYAWHPISHFAGTTLPATCSGGQIAVDTDAATTKQFYVCEAGTWVLASGAGNAATKVTTAFSATPTFTANANTATSFFITLTGNVTSSTLASASTGQLITFNIIQDATGGRTFVPPSNVIGMATIDTGANVTCSQSFVYDGTNAISIGSMSCPAAPPGVVLPGSTSGAITLRAPAVAGTNTLTFPAGTTDFSATGGANQFLKQSSAGAALTVGAIADADVPNLETLSTGLADSVIPRINSSGNLAATVSQQTSDGAIGAGGAPIGNGGVGLTGYGSATLRSVAASEFAYGLVFEKRGRTGDINGTPATGAELGYSSFRGWNGSAYTTTAGGIVAVASENWTGTANGTRLQFYTTPNTTTPNKWSAVLDNLGNFGLTSNTQFAFSSSSTDPSTFDSGIKRVSAAKLQITNGSTGSGVLAASDAAASGDVVTRGATWTDNDCVKLSSGKLITAACTGLATYANYKAAVCQGAQASLGFSTPTTNPAVAACVTGSNTTFGVGQFADGANTLSVQDRILLPPTFTGDVDVFLTWRTSAITGSVVWQVQTACTANGEVVDPSWNTASTVTDAADGTTNRYNTASITAVTITGCAADEEMFFRLFRDPTHASDNLAATAELITARFTIRRTN